MEEHKCMYTQFVCPICYERLRAACKMVLETCPNGTSSDDYVSKHTIDKIKEALK
jgi:hypothetical protein